MKAYLIDPEFGTISTIDISAMSTLKDLYRNLDCDLVDVVRDVLPGHDIFVDDEGLLYDTPPHGLFTLNRGGEHDEVLAGRAVLIGTDNMGSCADATCSPEDVQNIVRQITLIDGSNSRIRTSAFKII